MEQKTTLRFCWNGPKLLPQQMSFHWNNKMCLQEILPMDTNCTIIAVKQLIGMDTGNRAKTCDIHPVVHPFHHSWKSWLIMLKRVGKIIKLTSLYVAKISDKLWKIMIFGNNSYNLPIITDWPTSSPLIPARIFIAFVQNIASIPIYT